MQNMKAVQPILVGLISIALSIVAIDVWQLLGAREGGVDAVQQFGPFFKQIVGPFRSMPYIGAVFMLPLVLMKRMPQARRAVVGIFGVFMVAGILWWAMAAELPPGGPSREIVFARLCWFVLTPALYVAALYVPSITRYISGHTAIEQSSRQEILR